MGYSCDSVVAPDDNGKADSTPALSLFGIRKSKAQLISLITMYLLFQMFRYLKIYGLVDSHETLIK